MASGQEQERDDGNLPRLRCTTCARSFRPRYGLDPELCHECLYLAVAHERWKDPTGERLAAARR